MSRPIVVVCDDGSRARTFGRWNSAARCARNLLADYPWLGWVMVTDRRSGRTSVLSQDGEWVALPSQVAAA